MLLLPDHPDHCDIIKLFRKETSSEYGGFLRVAAPMVRYSKMEFRLLARKYKANLCFTPMIIADSFNRSEKARQNEFTTCSQDRPLIAQFAAKDTAEFTTAAKLIYPYVDGIDLNCGCPQSWAIAKNYGCGLLRNPEMVKDIIGTTRRLLPKDFSVSLKIRLLNGESTRSTIELARQLEMCGATFLTIHGRTARQGSSGPVNVEAIAELKKSIHIPLIANGDVRSWQDACKLHDATKADGIMCASGLLSNPTLFDPDMQERDKESLDCVQDWLDIADIAGEHLQFQTFHHHLTFMWCNHIKRKLRQEFNSFTSKEHVLAFFENNYHIKPRKEKPIDAFEYTKCNYTQGDSNDESEDQISHESSSKGKFYNEFIEAEDTIENDEDYYSLEDSFYTQLYL